MPPDPFESIVKKAFTGNQRIKTGRPRCVVKTTTGAPSSAAKEGTLLLNSFALVTSICTVAAGTWVKINS